MDVLLCTASIWHMCTMSLDRYCTLRYPISYGRSRTRTSVAIKIAFVWVVSTAVCAGLAIAGFANYSNVYVEGQCVPAVKDFILYGSIFAFYVPLLIMVVTYVLTLRILVENRRTMASIGLHTTASGGKLAGKGNWITRRRGKWRGPVASLIGNDLRQNDEPLTGRYRRKETALPRSMADGSKPERAAKLQLSPRRKGVDDQSNIASSVTVLHHSDRNPTEPDPTAAPDGDGGNDLSTSRQPPDNHNHSLSQPSTANVSYRSTTPPTSNPSHEPDPHEDTDTHQDDVSQLCWVTLSSPQAISPPCDCPEHRRRQSACRQRFKSPLRSDRVDVLASSCHSFKETASSNSPTFRIVENLHDDRRRVSDSALVEYGQTSVRNQILNSKAYRGSTWSLFHRKRYRPFCSEPYSTMVDQQGKATRSVVETVRNSAIMVDFNICNCCKNNRISTAEFSDRGVKTVEAVRPIFSKSTTTPDLLAVCSPSRPTRNAHRDADRKKERVSQSAETSWRRSDQAETVPGDRTTVVKWSECSQGRAETDVSVSPGSTSLTEATGRFQMSTFRRSRNSVSTATSLSTSTTSLNRRHTIATKERKASKVLGIIFAVFLLLWTPFFVVNLMTVVCASCLEALGSTGMSSIVWLGYASSLANPIVYTMFSTSFRTVFYRILTFQVCRERSASGGVHSGTSCQLSRQVTLGNALASMRQRQQQLQEMSGLSSRGTISASKSQTGNN